MLGIALGLFSTSYYPQYTTFWQRLLAWALGWGYREHSVVARDVYLRVLGVEVIVTWMSPLRLMYINKQRNKAPDTLNNIVEMLKKLAETVQNEQETTQNAQKEHENTQNNEKIDENSEKRPKPVYQAVGRDIEGVTTLDIRSSDARDMISGENFQWVLDSIDSGVSLIVNDRSLVDETERSFTLPEYDKQESIEIGSIVLFGNKDSHVRAKVTGYAQTPEGDRIYYYAKSTAPA